MANAPDRSVLIEHSFLHLRIKRRLNATKNNMNRLRREDTQFIPNGKELSRHGSSHTRTLCSTFVRCYEVDSFLDSLHNMIHFTTLQVN